MKRTVENIKDPLFRFFEREVNAGARLLADVRRDMADVLQVCDAEKKPTNHHRTMMADLVKGGVLVYVTDFFLFLGVNCDMFYQDKYQIDIILSDCYLPHKHPLEDM